MSAEKLSVRGEVHRIGISVIEEVRNHFFKNTDLIAPGIQIQECSLPGVGKIVNFGEIPEDGCLEHFLNLSAVQVVLIHRGPGIRVGRGTFQIGCSLWNARQPDDFCQLIFRDQFTLHGSYFCGKSAVREDTSHCSHFLSVLFCR